MSVPTVTSAVLCRKIQMPDGPGGPATLVGVLHEILFLANYEAPVFDGYLYFVLEADGGVYGFSVTWKCEATALVYESGGTIEIEPGAGLGHLPIPIKLECRSDGWYSLEIRVEGELCSRQSIAVRRLGS